MLTLVRPELCTSCGVGLSPHRRLITKASRLSRDTEEQPGPSLAQTGSTTDERPGDALMARAWGSIFQSPTWSDPLYITAS